jgi:hypothetical protein
LGVFSLGRLIVEEVKIAYGMLVLNIDVFILVRSLVNALDMSLKAK